MGPQAPFVAVAACNLTVLVCAVAYRIIELQRDVPVVETAE